MLKTNKEIEEKFVEKGAELEHDRWARWQEYMFSKFVEHENGKGEYLCLHKDFWKRWNRQIDTKYIDLSEEEKESDRKETRNYLPLVLSQRSEDIAEIQKMIEKTIEEYEVFKNKRKLVCEQNALLLILKSKLSAKLSLLDNN